MGLDVRVYKNIQLTDDEDEYDFMAYVDHYSWKWKIKNLQENRYYNGESVYHIRCSYSTHSRFREHLLRLIDRGEGDLLDMQGRIKWELLSDDVPFIDLIDFSDCEGCLDWEVSEKIYQDFKKYENEAVGETWDYFQYKGWMETFNLARQNGVVVFR